ncbi:bifunctional diguanylate cyclase/phosphodiesterase [Curvibacter sp. CHRR-16]|uniref:putative bifunctional diguanylate cyclase/phosphodiesterase n=1 Tax=Curvibacter sp. CHRR-16 TaxID=2835872 RepID=UPI001BDAE5FA|nr:bifunctional diguanylate cyclase/phosphodiesterase [Curvibacter sp. CHRR-16]MBT0571038.1 bifunctional diguanylate cyclase/phosphodiesterase [Curvibacter sp. CHRR-16]
MNTFYVVIPLLGVLTIDKVVRSPESSHYSIFFRVLAAWTMVLLAYNWLSPYGYRFDSIDASARVLMPWDESLLLLRGAPSVVIDLAWLSGVFAILYVLRMVSMVHHTGDKPTTVYLLATVTLVLLTTGIDRAIDAGLLDFPYLDGFAVVLLSFVWFALLGRDIRKSYQYYASTKDKLYREIEQIKSSDLVTHLPNRAGTLQLLRPLLDQHRENGTGLAVFLLDIDRMDVLRGTYGHEAADTLLSLVATRLTEQVRDSDWVARGAGTTFVVVATGMKRGASLQQLHSQAALQLHEKINSVFALPFTLDGHEIRLSSYTGVALYPDNGTTADSLLACAELALHEAKNQSSTALQAFYPELRKQLRSQLEMESELQLAVQREQFELHYQPQVCAVTGRIQCMEALIRWRHASWGWVSPAQFIPLAENLGLIHPIGHWVFHTACQQLVAWRKQGHHDLRMAVNLSAYQLDAPELVGNIEKLLADYGLPSNALELEVTESVLLKNPQRAIERLQRLRQLGVRLMLDDFGTGYSSLSYLRVLPVHGFKLDRSFIQSISDNKKDMAICSTAIDLAKVLELEIVAEGVEQFRQAELLLEKGCSKFQGYWFSPPLNADSAGQCLRSVAAHSFAPTGSLAAVECGSPPLQPQAA